MSMPQVPPRPNRAQHQGGSTTMTMEPPKIPPRPSHRRADQSESPHRDSYAPSPLNGPPSGTSNGRMSEGVYNSSGQNVSSSSLGLPKRPSSVNLPSIGQEGEEYADIAYDEPETQQGNERAAAFEQTRNVDSNLPLHAPKPSLSTSDAKARIAAVTRTDSSQAAAVGIGKASMLSHSDDQDPQTRPLKAKQSFTRAGSSASTERPSSMHADGEHGIPEIGQRVPMYPDAGDVQAPSPSPHSQAFPIGIGYHNNGSQKSVRQRTRSGREVFQGPPGSYGLHGHGVAHPDRFEKAWYDKHPDALLREESGQYGPGIHGGRGEWALSSDDLNKIVRDTASRGSGFGTSPNIVGLPNEQIGYLASDEYTSRMNSPHPQSSLHHTKTHSSHSQTHVESPLRKASFPVDSMGKDVFDKSLETQSKGHRPSDHALESETEDDDVIHIDAPSERTSKYTGNGYDPPTEDLGPHGGSTDLEGGWVDEHGYGTPILASDEVAKEPGMEYLQPAVSPVQERRGSAFHPGSRSGSAASSRPGSRAGSIHGSLPGLARFISHDEREDVHTPLEDVDEYEPLFPDDEGKTRKSAQIKENMKPRMEIKRRFPSQDIWEDTPNSLQLQATVSTPELPADPSPFTAQTATAAFETPEAEAARKGQVSEEEKAKLIPKEERWAKSNFKPHLREDTTRPGLAQRFPSRDIWEDTPDSAQLETTVGEHQIDGSSEAPDEGLNAGAVVITSGRPDEDKVVGDQPRDGVVLGPEKPSVPPRPVRSKHTEEFQGSPGASIPSIPARPPQKFRQIPPAPSQLSKSTSESSPTETAQMSPVDSRKAPVLPDRPKPLLPARPTKPVARDSSEGVPLSKTTSATSTGSNNDSSASSKGITSPPAPKPKPVLPSRPAGNKIAALKASFMSDLDKRLQVGPQAPAKAQEAPAEEVKDEEKAPLTDARKGRARGPARRKPAASPGANAAELKPSTPQLGFVVPWTIWELSTEEDGGHLTVHNVKPASGGEKSKELAKPTGEPTIPHATESEVVKPDAVSSVVPEKTAPVIEKLSLPIPSEEEKLYNQREEDVNLSAGGLSVQDVIDDYAKSPSTLDEPSTFSESLDKAHLEVVDAGVQTGEKNITLNSTSDVAVKLTAYEGGMAQREGDVLVQEQAEKIVAGESTKDHPEVS